MSNSINGSNFVYNRDGILSGVKYGSEEANEIIQKNSSTEIKDINGEKYIIIDNTSRYFHTVEELGEKEITNAFLRGDLEVSELEKGLNANNVKDLNITTSEDGLNVVVTYTNENGKKVTLKCTTEAAKSQADNIKVNEVLDEELLSHKYVVNNNYDMFFEKVATYEYENGNVEHKYKLKDGCTLEDAKAYRDNIINNADHLYSVSDSIEIFMKGSTLNSSEQRQIERGEHINGYTSDADWNNLLGEICTVEGLTIDQITKLCGKNWSEASQIPTSEIYKWAEANGATIQESTTHNEYINGDIQKLTITTADGKTYDIEQISNENIRDTEFLFDNYLRFAGNPNAMTTVKLDEAKGIGFKTAKVTNAQELREAMLQEGTAILLMNDIDMSGIDWEPIDFTGFICGGEHKISNLHIKGDGDEVAFIKTLNGDITDIEFENVTVENAKTEYPSCTAVVVARFADAGKESRDITGIDLTNCTVKGGAMTGGIVGDKEGKYVNIRDCQLTGCDITGDYSTGGVAGYAYGGQVGGSVSDTVLNNGQWIGAIVGSGDNLRVGGKTSDVTINGGYHDDQPTLGAGGIIGRVGKKEGDDTQSTIGGHDIKHDEDYKPDYTVTINNAYATGTIVGWNCNLDPETGKVIEDGDMTCDIGRGQVGRTGQTEWSVVKSLGKELNMQDALIELQAYAEENGLEEIPGAKGVYQDPVKKGNYYYLHRNNVGNRYDIVNGNTPWESEYILANEGAVEVIYKRDGVDCMTDAMYAPNSVEYLARNSNGEKYGNEVPDEIYYKTADGNWHKFSTTNYRLKNLTAGTYTNEHTTESMTYTSTFEDYAAYKAEHMANSSADLEMCPIEYVPRNYALPYDNGYTKPHFCIEDVTYEEVLAQLGAITGQPPYNCGYVDGAENGIVADIQSDLDPMEGYTKLDKDSPEVQNMKIEDIEENLLLQAFLTGDNSVEASFANDVKVAHVTYELGWSEQLPPTVIAEHKDEDGNVISYSYKSGESVWHPASQELLDKYSMDDLVYIKKVQGQMWSEYLGEWPDELKDYELKENVTYTTEHRDTKLFGKLNFTAENIEKYKDSINLYDVEEMKQAAIEKLTQTDSWKLFTCELDDEGMERKCPNDLKELVKLLGGTDIKWEPYHHYTSQFGSEITNFHYISFTLDGTRYKLPVSPAGSGSSLPPEDTICTKEQVEALSQYVDATEYQYILDFYFTPAMQINGETLTYMFSWGGNHRWEKDRPMGMTTPTGPEYNTYTKLLEYLKNNKKA